MYCCNPCPSKSKSSFDSNSKKSITRLDSCLLCCPPCVSCIPCSPCRPCRPCVPCIPPTIIDPLISSGSGSRGQGPRAEKLGKADKKGGGKGGKGSDKIGKGSGKVGKGSGKVRKVKGKKGKGGGKGKKAKGKKKGHKAVDTGSDAMTDEKGSMVVDSPAEDGMYRPASPAYSPGVMGPSGMGPAVMNQAVYSPSGPSYAPSGPGFVAGGGGLGPGGMGGFGSGMMRSGVCTPKCSCTPRWGQSSTLATVPEYKTGPMQMSSRQNVCSMCSKRFNIQQSNQQFGQQLNVFSNVRSMPFGSQQQQQQGPWQQIYNQPGGSPQNQRICPPTCVKPQGGYQQNAFLQTAYQQGRNYQQNMYQQGGVQKMKRTCAPTCERSLNNYQQQNDFPQSGYQQGEEYQQGIPLGGCQQGGYMQQQYQQQKGCQRVTTCSVHQNGVAGNQAFFSEIDRMSLLCDKHQQEDSNGWWGTPGQFQANLNIMGGGMEAASVYYQDQNFNKAPVTTSAGIRRPSVTFCIQQKCPAVQ